MRSRVMPGSFVTMERRVPVKRLNSVDLPTLGRPTITRDGSRAVMNFRCSAVLQSTASRQAPEAIRHSKAWRAREALFLACEFVRETLIVLVRKVIAKQSFAT